MSSPVRAYLALGGNVGDSRTILARAVGMLCEGREVILVARSSDYRTPPWGDTDQPPFINLVIAVNTTLPPRALLARGHNVESALGRDRANKKRWGPRSCDVDLIAYGDTTIDEPDFQVPHPRLFERAFVLVPLAEIAPNLVIAGRRVSDALAQLDTAGIEKLP